MLPGINGDERVIGPASAANVDNSRTVDTEDTATDETIVIVLLLGEKTGETTGMGVDDGNWSRNTPEGWVRVTETMSLGKEAVRACLYTPAQTARLNRKEVEELNFPRFIPKKYVIPEDIRAEFNIHVAATEVAGIEIPHMRENPREEYGGGKKNRSLLPGQAVEETEILSVQARKASKAKAKARDKRRRRVLIATTILYIRERGRGGATFTSRTPHKIVSVPPHTRVITAEPFWKGISQDPTITQLVREGAPPALAHPLPGQIVAAMYHQNADQKAFLSGEFQRLLDEGSVQYPTETPKMISPCFTVPKVCGDGTVTHRLTIDATNLNAYVRSLSFQTTTIEDVVLLASAQDEASVFDLSNAFFSVPASAALRPYLCCWAWLGGEWRVIQFNCLYFGWELSPFFFNRLLTALRTHWRGPKCIRTSHYGDDIIMLLKRNNKMAAAIIHSVKNDIAAAGLIINETKSQVSQREVIYIGYLVSLQEGRLYVKPKRLQKMITKVSALNTPRVQVTCRQLAEVQGAIVSAKPVFGSRARLRLRGTNAWVAQYAPSNKAQWDETHPPTPALSKELDWWSQFLKKDLRGPSRAMWKKPVCAVYVSATDASAIGTGGAIYDTRQHLSIPRTMATTFTERERALSSAHRECLAVKQMVICYTPLCQGGVLNNMTDSTAAVAVFTYGSNVPELQEIATEVEDIAEAAGVLVRHHWHRRSTPMGVHADAVSRIMMGDTCDYTLRTVSFQHIAVYMAGRFGLKPGCDCFATEANSKCTSFYSRTFMVGTLGADVRDHPLGQIHGQWYYAFPPPHLALSFLRRMPLKTHTILILPEWRGQVWWPFLFSTHETPPFRFEVLNRLNTTHFRKGPIGRPRWLHKDSNTMHLVILIHGEDQ
jgi:hypothetical protein